MSMLHALACNLQAEPFAIAKWKTVKELPESGTHMASCVALDDQPCNWKVLIHVMIPLLLCRLMLSAARIHFVSKARKLTEVQYAL